MYNALQDELSATESLLQKAQRFERMAGTYTPRPNWPQIRGGGPFLGFPTTQQAAEIVDENKELTQRNLDLEAEAVALAVALAEVLFLITTSSAPWCNQFFHLMDVLVNCQVVVL